MRWLAECSAEALGEALRVVAPDLSGFRSRFPLPTQWLSVSRCGGQPARLSAGGSSRSSPGHVLPPCAWCVRAASVGICLSHRGPRAVRVVDRRAPGPAPRRWTGTRQWSSSAARASDAAKPDPTRKESAVGASWDRRYCPWSACLRAAPGPHRSRR